MKAVIQRVTSASLHIGGAQHANIGRGFVVLLGIEIGDSPVDRAFIAEKTAHLRIFADEAGKMNRSLTDIKGSVLLVPNFTLAGDCRRGRRPSFENAMKPPESNMEFEAVAAAIRAHVPDVAVVLGVFGADMQITLLNDGPVTLLLDSKNP